MQINIGAWVVPRQFDVNRVTGNVEEIHRRPFAPDTVLISYAQRRSVSADNVDAAYVGVDVVL